MHLGEENVAVAILNSVLTNYPGGDAAARATTQLKRIHDNKLERRRPPVSRSRASSAAS